MKSGRLKITYLVSDIIASAAAWTLFFFFRKMVFEQKIFGPDLVITADSRLLTGVIVIPVFWILLYFIAGYYNNPLRKSRLADFGSTLAITIIGTTILFFTLILDDFISAYTNYYISFAVLFALQFTLTYIPRLIITSRIVYLIHSGRIGFKTLIVGGNGRAMEIYESVSSQSKSSGNIFAGFINLDPSTPTPLEDHLPDLGPVSSISSVIREHEIEEVIIAIEEDESHRVQQIISGLRDLRVIIKAVPGMYDLLLGRIRMSTIFGTPLILLKADSMPTWQYNIKRLFDYFIALVMMILLAPLSLALAIAILSSGRGPVIFRQERIGRGGKPFYIYKFRSMYPDAEKEGPALSSADDPRITPVGKFMRKHRFDEIPNFINVLKGEMSIVGPRPERKVYIDQILEKAPHYQNLLKIKPGITSWGQVKFGYASTIDEMVERLKYDLLYLDNMSLYVDLKIIIYTIITIVKGQGL